MTLAEAKAKAAIKNAQLARQGRLARTTSELEGR